MILPAPLRPAALAGGAVALLLLLAAGGQAWILRPPATVPGTAASTARRPHCPWSAGAGSISSSTTITTPAGALLAKPPRRWGGVRRQIGGGDGDEEEGGNSSSNNKSPPPAASRPKGMRRPGQAAAGKARGGAEEEDEEEDDPLAISDAQIAEAMGRKRGAMAAAAAADAAAGRGAPPAAKGAGGEPEKWSMEWLESLSEAEMLALDKRRLMDFLLRDIESDREWAGVPDEAVFAAEEEVDPKADFYDEKLTEAVFGKMPPLEALEDEDDFNFDEEEEEEDDDDDLDLEDIFGELDAEDEEEEDLELLRLLQGAQGRTPEEVQARLAAALDGMVAPTGEDPLDPLLNDDERRDDAEDEDVYDMGGHLQPDEAAALGLGDGDGDGVRRLLAGLGKGKLAAEGTDAAQLMGAVRACLDQGDLAAASELLQRMEELGVEVGDLEEHAEALEAYRPAGVTAAAKARRRVVVEAPMRQQQQQQQETEETEQAAVPLSGGVLSEEAVAAMKAQGACVGIDLGTTNSAVAVVKDGRAVILPCSATGDNVLPSAVRFLPPAGGVVVGQAALDAALDDADNTFTSVKRLIGRGLEELVREKELLAAVNLVSVPAVDPETGEADPEGGESVALYCPALRREVTPEEVSAEVLKALIADAAAYLGAPVNRAVITVPAYFTPEQCAATERAGKLAGLQRIKLLREPEAAALAYGLDKAEEEELIMVFDLGGGTFDVSVLAVGDGVAEVLATFGDNHLGGNDWDQRIAEWLAGEYKKQHGVAPPSDRLTTRRLLEAAERAKVRLSGRGATTTEVELPALGGKGKDLKVRLSRQQMEALCADLYDRLLEPMRQAALMAGATLGGEVAPERVGSELIGLGEEEDDEEEGEDGDEAEAIRRLEGGDRKLAEALRERTLAGRQASRARAQFTKQLSAVRKRNPGVKVREFPRGRPLTEVVMVGGATRMPSIQRLVEAVTGIRPRTTVNPDEAVALGAGIHAGVLDGVIEDLEMMTPMQAAILRGVMEYEARGGAGERKGPQLKTGKRTGLF